jgi:hypothetical protein
MMYAPPQTNISPIVIHTKSGDDSRGRIVGPSANDHPTVKQDGKQVRPMVSSCAGKGRARLGQASGDQCFLGWLRRSGKGLWQSVRFDCFDGSPKSLRPTERSHAKPCDLAIVRHFPPAPDIADNALRAVVSQIKRGARVIRPNFQLPGTHGELSCRAYLG